MASISAPKPSSAMNESPNWLEIPDEVIIDIFQRLRTFEILNSARKVCKTWRRICKNPTVWKAIVMDKSFDDWEGHYDLLSLTKQAVHLSCGELTQIRIAGFGTDELLDHIVLRSCKLSRLSLMCCNDITGSGLSRAVKRLPQLEKLHLTFVSFNAKDIECIGQNCPKLKSFMSFGRKYPPVNCDDDAHAIANNMPGLHHLRLLDSGMSKNGLKAIENGCPHLQSLTVCSW